MTPDPRLTDIQNRILMYMSQSGIPLTAKLISTAMSEPQVNVAFQLSKLKNLGRVGWMPNPVKAPRPGKRAGLYFPKSP